MEKIKKFIDSQKPSLSIFFDAWVAVTKSGQIIEFNQQFTNILNVTKKSLIKNPKNLLDLFLFEDNMQICKLLQTENNKVARIDDIRCEIPSKPQPDSVITFSCYPIKENNELIGAIFAIRDVSADHNLQHQYKEKSISSITDALTQINNRYSYQQYLLNLNQRSEKPHISIIMCDIDFFKKINDHPNLGHAAGDMVLKEVANLIKSKLRTSDFIARLGGEEFVVFLDNCEYKKAMDIAELLRKSIEDMTLVYNQETVKITMSFGVSSIEKESDSIEKKVIEADEKLYESKRTGRNKVS